MLNVNVTRNIHCNTEINAKTFAHFLKSRNPEFGFLTRYIFPWIATVKRTLVMQQAPS